jgi:hypothetical protein
MWKSIKGTDYRVSDRGDVERNGRLIGGYVVTGGYMVVGLSCDGKRNYHLRHRLVLETFISECPDGCEADHINGDVTDNRLENLRWLNRYENRSRQRLGCLNHQCRMTPGDISAIRKMRERGMLLRVIASKFNCSFATVSRIANGQRHSTTNNDICR